MFVSKISKYLFFCGILNVTIFSLLYYLVCYDTETSYQRSNKSLDLKYLLIWTSNMSKPIKFLGEGTNTFKNRNCSYTNCYVSSNRKLFKNVAEFDVILFHGPELDNKTSSLPKSRSPRQKYIFASMESAANYPVCNEMYDGYFNWTWTYKLDSDENYGYLSIRDKEGKVIGPKEEMHWKKLEEMMPINDTLKAKLRTKKIAVAWFVSNCKAPSGRDLLAKQLQIELAKYGMQVDIFGKCGPKKCPSFRKLEKDYYFFLSFENSVAEDYVTEKLLHALNHYAVPVVYGGANYTRFMPDGIYLSAQRTTIRELAKIIANSIEDNQKYYDFFKWHNHYSYHYLRESSETDAYCKLCALINNKAEFEITTIYDDFCGWWSPLHKCQ